MIVIVGLGNPGKKYKNTRHNVGFMAVDEFRKENDFPNFKLSKKFSALIAKGIFNGNEIILAKPQTFMNKSGVAVKKFVSSFKLQVSRIWVVHDDIDLSLGKIKIVKNRGAAGHKGVQSTINELGTKNFIRFRIGIQARGPGLKNVESFVLQKFNKEEKKILKEVIKKTVKATEMGLKKGIEKAMSEYNK